MWVRDYESVHTQKNYSRSANFFLGIFTFSDLTKRDSESAMLSGASRASMSNSKLLSIHRHQQFLSLFFHAFVRLLLFNSRIMEESDHSSKHEE